MIENIETEQVDPGRIASAVKSEEQGERCLPPVMLGHKYRQFMERAYMDALAKSLGISDGEKNNIENEARAAREQLVAAVNRA